MNVDFAAVLVSLTFVTGIIWAIDNWMLLPRRRAKAAELMEEAAVKKAMLEPKVVEYARSFFPVILIVLLLRSFLVEPFRIPSNSMMPTLLTGDFILVNKFSFGLRLPVLNLKFIDFGQPERGDVIVFRYPRDPSVDYIKRVIGVPGDKVVYRRKMLYINGELIAQDRVGKYRGIGSGIGMTGNTHLIEKLEGVDHSILVDPRRQRLADVNLVIPEGQYFVMGDNRDNSNDSRIWGTVPEANLVGKAFMIWMNWDSAADGIDWGRIGDSID